MRFIDSDLVRHAEILDLHYVNGFFDGFVRSLYLFAHWRDGEMYVGSGGSTYKEVRAEFVKEFDEKIGSCFGEKAPPEKEE